MKVKKFQPAVLPDTVKKDYESVWLNDFYQVIVYDAKKVGMQSPNFPDMWWLSIKRIDKQPIHDWRDLQRIKNMIIGAKNEALELYPAEDRVVDMANQYHLFVFKDETVRVPFGFFDGRMVGTPAEAEKIGAKQRKL